jgi:hypothetical protein
MQPRRRNTPPAARVPRNVLTLDSLQYALDAGAQIDRRPFSLFENEGPILARNTHKPPWGIGLRNGMVPNRVLAEENVNSLFGVITRGPQKQTLTIPSGTVALNHFQEANSQLYAMSRRTTLIAGQTNKLFYFHDATDDRVGGKTMNSSIGAVQASNRVDEVRALRQVLGNFTSPALGSQVIASQNWTVNIARMQETEQVAETVTIYSVLLYVYRPASQTVVGYIIGAEGATGDVDYATASENTADDTIQSFQDNVFSGSAVTVQNGDVLRLKIQVRNTNEGVGELDNPNITLYYDGTTVNTGDNVTVSDHASVLTSTNNITMSGALPTKVAGRLTYLTSSNTLTDTTIDTDLGVNYVQGITMSSQRLLALSALPYSPVGGQNYSVLAQSWDGLIWTNTNFQVQNQFLMVDIVDVAGTIYVLYADDVSYPTYWRISALSTTALTGDTVTSFGTALATQASTIIPLRMIAYPNDSGVEKAWVSTAEGLYMNVGSSMVLMRRWFDTASGYSGTQLSSGIIAGVDSILFNDGHNSYQGFWRQGGSGSIFTVISHGPQSVEDGLPFDQQGPVTALAYAPERDWLAAGTGGLDGNHFAGTFIHTCLGPEQKEPGEIPTGDIIHRPYENATANRVIRAMTFTRENDGVSKLIWTEDNGVTDDVTVFMHTYILDHPDTISTYPFNAGGNVTFSQWKPKEGAAQVGFGAISVEARDLSSSKSITIQDGQDGSAPANAQTIERTASTGPPQVWPDKTDASAGVGVAARSQQILMTLADSAGATSTAGPSVLEVSEAFTVKSTTPGGELTEVFTFSIDLLASSQYGSRRGSPKNTWDDLYTTAKKHTLVPLVLPGGETVQVTIEIGTVLEGQEANSIQQSPAGGVVQVRCWRMQR